ncbi:MAG TPA: hypothetical protein VEC12_08510 [Bacteroidia bacterium]|nr:hypothetical protein [Bacteroidia bacterium]
MQNYKKIIELLDSEACKSFIKELVNVPPADIALHYRNKLPCDASALALIIQLYKKAAEKLPLWTENYCALTPRSFEQATSQVVASYKSTFISGGKLLVLAGGLGVDEWAFSTAFSSIVSIDNDEGLNEIVAFNSSKLKVNNVKRITTTAEKFISANKETFDCVYTDPDRRDEKGARKITLTDSQPDIIGLYPQLCKITHKIIVKASPMLDIKAAVTELPGVNEVRVIAVKGEVKEILLTSQSGYSGTPNYKAANYENGQWQEFSATPEQDIEISSSHGPYFFEPNAAIIKAGLHHALANNLQLNGIDKNSAYYTGNAAVGFQGRMFKIISVVPFSKSKINAYLKEQNIKAANVAKRNFRLTTEDLKKTFKIKDGGPEYLFFTQQNGQGLMFHCRRG